LDKSQGNSLFVFWDDKSLSDGIHPGILKYGIVNEFDLGGRYHELPPFSAKQTPDLPPIQGAWSGHFFLDIFQKRSDSLVDIVITNCTADGQFEGHGFEAMDGQFEVNGIIQPGDRSDFKVKMARKYLANMGRAPIDCVGGLDLIANKIQLNWGFTSERMIKPVVLTRTPSPLYRFRYTNAAFESNRARARWSFACMAVLYQVRQRNFSWSFVQENIARRKRFVSIHIRRDLGWSLYAPIDDLKVGEVDELQALELATSPYDNRLFRLIAKAQLRRTPIHQ
jgi:hypothetical protein